MRKFITKITLLLLSVVIFTTGMGATIANFCCDNCLNEFFALQTIDCGKQEVKEHSCCSSESQPVANVCRNHTGEDDTCCKIERHSIDLDSFHSKPVVFLPYTWIATIIPQIANFSFTDEYHDIIVDNNNDPPPITEPRTYLSIIRILII